MPEKTVERSLISPGRAFVVPELSSRFLSISDERVALSSFETYADEYLLEGDEEPNFSSMLSKLMSIELSIKESEIFMAYRL